MLALEGMMNAQRTACNGRVTAQTSLSVTASLPMRRQAQRSSQRNGTSVVTEIIATGREERAACTWACLGTDRRFEWKYLQTARRVSVEFWNHGA